VYDRGRLWIDNQDPASRKGATIGWVRRYQAADGQLYAVLLSAYVFLTFIPLVLVYTSYAYSDPAALAKRLDNRLDLGADTSKLVQTVLSGNSGHKLSVALIAVVNLFFFGLGFGRVLQLVHARSWGLDLRKRAVLDQVRYLEVLGSTAVLALVYVLQTRALAGDASWLGWALDVVWVAVLVGFFVWAPWLLLGGQVAGRDILPGAVFTVLAFIGMRIVSYVLLKNWLEWYSSTYGAIGIVLALFFWIIIFATIMVLAAALSPALAHRRNLLRAQLGAPAVGGAG
jgi:uncharacterized BrkB/YihY/UPF0761 family membrane protein